ncbi:hypothetical protein KY360_02305 [Candidatus Woesearchaeota archaeon]|nr:hypothetical protein [Candidatus Woesearchaeota archaeon]
MTLDEKLQELGVNMAAVSGLRRTGHFDEPYIQGFIDKGQGSHLKWAMDLLQETHNASEFADYGRMKYFGEMHPISVADAAVEVSELLEKEGRQDVLETWGNALRKYYADDSFYNSRFFFVKHSPGIIRQLAESGNLDDFAEWERMVSGSSLAEGKGFHKYYAFVYGNSLPMAQVLKGAGWRDYFNDWIEWITSGNFSNDYDCKEGRDANYHLKKLSDDAASSAAVFRKHDDLGRFGRIFRLLAPPHWGRLWERTELFSKMGSIYEAFAKHGALKHFDALIEYAEENKGRESKYYHAFSLMQYSCKVLEAFASRGKLDRFEPWLRTAQWHEEWAIEGSHRGQTDVKRHYFQAALHDIPFSKITSVCWALWDLNERDYDSLAVRQAIMSEMPKETKGDAMIFYSQHLKKCSDRALSEFFDYAAEHDIEGMHRPIKKMDSFAYDDLIQTVDSGEITFADFAEICTLVRESTIGFFEGYMVRELVRPDRRSAVKNLERALAVFDAHPVIEAPDYVVAGLMHTQDDSDFSNVEEALRLFEADTGVLPTEYLLSELLDSKDKKATYEGWARLMDTFADGNFDAGNELHRSLEYTRFRRIVDHKKVKGHVKNHFTFKEYSQIFERQSEGKPFTEEDRFEIECVVDEAIVLRDFILEESRRAAEQGRKTLVVPNLSYGYLPVAPLVEELSAKGIEFLIGAKVGSSECHDNKEYTDSRLFKGKRTKMMNEQPLVIVVDGTKHLVARGGEDKGARYPDSHTGYLNQAIAMNDAMGYVNIDYSWQGKRPDDIERLRQDPEFQRSVEVYKHVLKSGNGGKPYSFEFWNTAGMKLIIRNYHQKIMDIEPMDPAKMQGPAMVFCNAGLLHEQVSEAIRERYPNHKHQPAKFDDSHKIIAFDFGYDNRGVRYLNRLETEVKKTYARQTCTPDSTSDRFMPEIVRYIERHGNMPTTCCQS